jgi:hypothetical protein
MTSRWSRVAIKNEKYSSFSLERYARTSSRSLAKPLSALAD